MSISGAIVRRISAFRNPILREQESETYKKRHVTLNRPDPLRIMVAEVVYSYDSICCCRG